MKLPALPVALLALLALALGFAGDAAGSAGASPAMVSVAAAPQFPSGAAAVGAVAATTTETGAVVLRPRDESALRAFISAVTTAGSPEFHHYLAPGQFATSFGPDPDTIASVRAALAGDGLTVTGVSSDGLLVSFSGSAAVVERAFDTGLARLRLADGSIRQATTSPVSVPAAIAGSVASVVGLDSLVSPQPEDLLPSSSVGAHPAATAAAFAHPAGAPNACLQARFTARRFGGLTDDEIANAYGAFGLYARGDLGAGQHIAVFELEPFLPADITTFDRCYFGAAAAARMASRLTIHPVAGGQPTGTGSGEATLDIEDVSALAPGADIDVYEAPNNVFDNSDFGGLDEYAQIVDDDRDQIVTTSWGLCEQAVQDGTPGVQEAESFLFEQAAAQGQSVFSAAGDTGSDDCNSARATVPPSTQNPVSVDDPSSQPYVVAVGGTTIDDASSQPPAEHVWNGGATGGAGGGGISQSWAMPSWQRDARVPGIVLPGSADYTNANQVEAASGYPTGFCQATLGAGTACRTLPDVSAQADEYTGAITIYGSQFVSPLTPSGWITIGGTSSAAPIWAALLADINASATCRSDPATASGVGFVSPLLYGVASDPTAYAASFNDITTGNNDNYGLDDGLVFPASTGYDLASGLGSPQVTGAGGSNGLAYYLCRAAATAVRPLVTGISPQTVPVSGGQVTITGSGFAPGGSADVTGIEVGTATLPASAFTVTSDTSITATLPAADTTLPPGSPAPLDGAGPANIVVTLGTGASSAVDSTTRILYVDQTSGSAVPAVVGVTPSGGSETAPAAVTIFGSDFRGASKVTFGGVAAASFTVVSSSEITATPAPYSSATQCAPSAAGESPTTDLCQAQVQVTNGDGSSATGTILPPLEGTLPELNAEEVFDLPPGCNCEQEPAPTEYDYAPAPSVTSISTSPAAPGSLASEDGGTLITVTGTGLDLLTLDWVDIGDPTLAVSQDFSETYISGTEIQIVAPPTASPTIDPTTLPLSVQTLAGQSNSSPVTYAGVPTVTSAVNTATGLNGAPDTGGTPITITGQGFDQAVGPIVFTNASSSSVGTQYTYTVTSDTSISTQTVSQNPALVDVEVCSVTACSLNPPADEMYLYPPGDPSVTSVTPSTGGASGGTFVVIHGANLGCVTSVDFGSVAAKTFANVRGLLDCGSTSTVYAVAPAGTSATTVPVTVTTVESDDSGAGRSPSTAAFTYR